jgi:sec-independent protein translocase protein TatC
MTEPENKERESQIEDEFDDWDDDDEDETSTSRMGFLDHLGELRDRIFRVILALVLGIVLVFNFADYLWIVIEGPAEEMLKTAQEKSLSVVKSSEEIAIELPRFPKLPFNNLDENEREELEDTLDDWREEASEELDLQIKNILKAKDARLMQTSITEAFFLKIKISFFGAILLMYPYIMYQVWAFVAPGLYRHERRLALPFIIFTTLFFGLGVAFAYYIAVPFAGTFLMSFGAEFVQMITIEKYMDFLTTMMLGLGIVFEIPMLIFILSKLGIVTPRFLMKNFRYAILIIFVVAAVITPTGDPINLMVFSAPMILLYLLGVGIAKLWGRKSDPEVEDEDWDDDDDSDDDPDDPDGSDDDDDAEADEDEKPVRSAADPYDKFYEENAGETVLPDDEDEDELDRIG